jgi:carbonic anhydrase
MFLQYLGLGTAGALVAAAASMPPRPVEAGQASRVTGVEQAMQLLQEGNRRHRAAKLAHPNQTRKRLREVARGQHPFAVILGCSDSRVPPEIIFDRGLGDLFVIRVAGNILDNPGLGSSEYALEEFGVPLVMVLGHQRCGAVAATIEVMDKGGKVHGQITSLVEAIRPAVVRARAQPGNLLENAVRSNVALVVAQLQASSPMVADLVKQGKVKVVGARYNLETGEVAIIA